MEKTDFVLSTRGGVLQFGEVCEYDNNFGVTIKLAIQMHLQVANHSLSSNFCDLKLGF